MDCDVGDDDVGRVLTLVRSSGLAPAVAEDVTVEVLRSFRSGAGPDWLVHAAPEKRLDVLTMLAVLRRRS